MAAIIFNETFTGTAGTALSTHNSSLVLHPTANNNAVLSNANRARGNGAALALYYANVTPSTEEYDVEVDVYVATVSTDRFVGPVGRLDPTAKTCYVAMYVGSRWDLYKVVAGASTQLGTFSATLTAGQTCRVKLEIRNAAKKVYIDGVERISSADNSITGVGKPGLWMHQSTTDTSQYHLDNFTVTASGVVSENLIGVSDANWFFSPYNWRKNGTSYAETNNPGAYFKTQFSGTSCKMRVDVSHLAAAGVTAANYPAIEWQVDGGAKTRVQLTSASIDIDLGSSYSAGVHTLFVQLVGAWWQTDRWNTPVMSLRVTGLLLADGEVLSAPILSSRRMLIFGDSHCEGYEALASGVSVANQDAGDAYGNILASRFGCEYGIIGFAGQGYNASVTGANVPDLEAAWSLYWAGQSRLSGGLLSPAPDYIVSAHGDNDIADTALINAVSNTIALLRTAAPSARIFICPPPNYDAEGKVSEIRDGVTAAADSDTYFLDTGENVFTTPAYLSGAHLSAAGHARYAQLVGDLIAPKTRRVHRRRLRLGLGLGF